MRRISSRLRSVSTSGSSLSIVNIGTAGSGSSPGPLKEGQSAARLQERLRRHQRAELNPHGANRHDVAAFVNRTRPSGAPRTAGSRRARSRASASSPPRGGTRPCGSSIRPCTATRAGSGSSGEWPAIRRRTRRPGLTPAPCSTRAAATGSRIRRSTASSRSSSAVRFIRAFQALRSVRNSACAAVWSDDSSRFARRARRAMRFRQSSASLARPAASVAADRGRVTGPQLPRAPARGAAAHAR